MFTSRKQTHTRSANVQPAGPFQFALKKEEFKVGRASAKHMAERFSAEVRRNCG